jgi:hypothetical protein
MATAHGEATTLFYGWRVVGAAFVLAVFGWGVGFYGPPIYLHAVRDARGWPLGLVSAAVTVHFLVGAVVVANLPRLHRRFGVPAITIAGALSLALGVVGWALAATPWHLFAATLFSGAGWVAMGAAAINAIVAPWFVARRPAALAAAYNGASIGGVVFSPLWVFAIERIGFAAAAAIVGAVMTAAVIVLAVVFFARTPQQMGLAPDGRPATSLAQPSPPSPARPAPLRSDRRFLTLAAGMALGLFAQIGLLAHLFSLLTPALGAQAAGFAMGAATAAAIGGRTLVGAMLPPGADRRLIACASYAAQVAGSLALLAAGGDRVVLLLLGVLLFGAGVGNATSLPPLIAQVEFTREQVGRVVALIVAVGQGFYAFAPAAFGAIRELAPTTDSASAVFLVAASLQGAAIVALLLGRAPAERRP